VEEEVRWDQKVGFGLDELWIGLRKDCWGVVRGSKWDSKAEFELVPNQEPLAKTFTLAS